MLIWLWRLLSKNRTAQFVLAFFRLLMSHSAPVHQLARSRSPCERALNIASECMHSTNRDTD